MKHIIIKSIAIIAILLGSCSKSLDLIPKDAISDATFWKSSNDYKLAANALYLSLEGFSLGDTESDIAFNNPNAISNGTYQTTETSDQWTNSYVYIRSCNNIISKAKSTTVEDPQGNIKRFAAEAKFFRAYNYWLLYRLYGGVPIITDVLDVNSPALFSERASRTETVDFMLNDLTEAAADLPLAITLSSSDIGRITKGAAYALKARVALFEGTWGKYRADANSNGYLDIAIEASNNVINSSQYGLYDGMGANSYRYLFIDQGDDSKECILDRRYQRDISGQSFPFSLGLPGYLPTKKLADMYLCSDGLPVTQSLLFQGYNTTTSEYQNRDPRMAMTCVIPGTFILQPQYPDLVETWPFTPRSHPNTGYAIYKYYSEDVFANMHSWDDNSHSFDHHIIRYAEVLLIYAEATFEKNGTISDADLDKSINVIRQRVSMPALTNAFVTTNGLDMKQEIRRERTIELALENFRYDDLRRWKTAETEMPQDIKGIKIKGSNWTDPVIIGGANKNPYAEASWQDNVDADGFIIAEKASARSFDPLKHYLRPLPLKEILINSKLIQNPQW
jgi:starch-binding outer membrane protein, SusD/RagB family